MAILVDDLVDQVRSMTEESEVDESTIDSSVGGIKTKHILQSLNRAQRHAANILSRKFEDMMWDSTTINSKAGVSEYDIPSQAYAGRIELIEVIAGNSSNYVLERLSNHRGVEHRYTGTGRPSAYSTKKNKFVIYPTPASDSTLVVHYNKHPADLVLQQGRITSINTAENYILVDDIGDAIKSQAGQFSSYINIVSYNTGEIKQTLQISSIDEENGQIIFKSTGLSREQVLGQTISTAIDETVDQDDYICVVTGTCVPEIDAAYTDYVTQHAVVAIKRRLGEPTQEEFAELKELEKELEKAWVGREQSHRIVRKSRIWRYQSGRSFRSLPQG